MSLATQAHAQAVSADRILELVNTERAKAGLGAVRIESRLNEAAGIKARDMAAKTYFDHVSPDGTDPWDLLARVGYDWAWAGENLALNSQTLSEEAIVKAWMESPGHRAIILTESHTETGIGIASGIYNGQSVTYISQFFASPKRTDTEQIAPTPVALSPATNSEPAVISTATATATIKSEVVTSKPAEVVPVQKVSAQKVDKPNIQRSESAITAATTTVEPSTSPVEKENKRSLKENKTAKKSWRMELSQFFNKIFAKLAKTAQAFIS